MDFDFYYTEEQEEFRKEVRAFIEENAYKDPVVPADPTRMAPEMYLRGREISRKLGEKGWLAPGYPKEYGGGGLSEEHRAILAEEFTKIRLERRWVGYAQVSPIMTAGIMTYGTEEQKRRLLSPILRGEWDGWQCFTEPEAGTDEASMKSTAIRDGDVYVINGDKKFVGQTPPPVRPDYLYWLAVSDPEAPRHQNISAFFIPAVIIGDTCAYPTLRVKPSVVDLM